jgi:hypothetical protein
MTKSSFQRWLVCTENLVRIDLMRESLNVGHDGRAALTLFASSFKSKSRLEAENAALRHQLIVLQRKVRGRVHLTNGDRLFLVQLYRWFPSVLKAITIAAAWPLAARAQQPTMPVIGHLDSGSSAPFAHLIAKFHQGLAETVDGHNVTIEYHWGEGRYEKLPILAADLVRRQVAVIVATGGELARRFRRGPIRVSNFVQTAVCQGAQPADLTGYRCQEGGNLKR